MSCCSFKKCGARANYIVTFEIDYQCATSVFYACEKDLEIVKNVAQNLVDRAIEEGERIVAPLRVGRI